MSILAMVALLELTLRGVLSNIPHDAGSVVVSLLLGGFVYFIWYGSRKSTIDRYMGTSDNDERAAGGSGG